MRIESTATLEALAYGIIGFFVSALPLLILLHAEEFLEKMKLLERLVLLRSSRRRKTRLKVTAHRRYAKAQLDDLDRLLGREVAMSESGE